MDLALVAARFTHFAATMTLFGSTFFAAALAPATMAGDLRPLLRRLAPALALLSLAAALAWLIFVARSMAGGAVDLETVRDVLTDTAFGAVWQARLALLVLLALATLRPGERWRFPALLAAMAMASLGLVGHAAMQEGAEGVGHRLNHAIHLLAGSAWLGGLPPFLACLTLYLRAPRRRDALAAMMAYSRFGHGFVAAVFVTGALDVALTTHALPWPADTPYRLGLDCKIAVFFVMTALALVNRYVFAPRIGRQPLAGRALAAGAVAEVVLALAAVALVSAFATFDPNPM